MKNAILAAVVMMSSAAFADGFVCENSRANLRIKIYHQTAPQLGTRNAAIMIVSNPSVSNGRKTIATFQSDKALLTSKSGTYTSNVDLRFKDSDRKGELIGGTKLGELDQIILSVDHDFAQPVPAGTELEGEVTLVRRDGATDHVLAMSCIRYLKGE